jgi:hypothetical protein
MGVDLDRSIDVQGALADYAERMFYDINEGEEATLDRNTQLQQLALPLLEMELAGAIGLGASNKYFAK